MTCGSILCFKISPQSSVNNLQKINFEKKSANPLSSLRDWAEGGRHHHHRLSSLLSLSVIQAAAASVCWGNFSPSHQVQSPEGCTHPTSNTAAGSSVSQCVGAPDEGGECLCFFVTVWFHMLFSLLAPKKKKKRKGDEDLKER